MNTLLAIIISLSVMVSFGPLPHLTHQDSLKEWTTLPSGLISVRVTEEVWAVFPAQTIPCVAKFEDHDGRMVIFMTQPIEGPPSCYLVYPEPIGHFDGDPNDPKNVNLKFTPTIRRTW